MAERSLKTTSGSIKATKVELWQFGKQTGTREELKQLCVDCQTMLNRMWQMWLIWHTEHGSRERILADLEAYKDWHESGKKGKKPTWSVQPTNKELSNKIYHQMSLEFPSINARTRVLLANKWEGSVRNRKSASGSLSGWVAVLLGRESLPSFTRPHPIPFDNRNAQLHEEDGKQWLTLRILRDEKSPAKAKPSVVEVVELMTSKRKARSVKQIVSNMIDGTWAFKGSSIVFDDGKWFASFSYQKPQEERQELLAENSITLIPGKKRPWILLFKVDGRRWAMRFGGSGDNVRYNRKRLLLERASRMQSYRWAGSNNKGHGRKRAELPWTKLRDRWSDFTKCYNRGVVKQLIDMALRYRVGTICYAQPKDAKRDKTFLARAGNWPNSAMSWDWYQVSTLLANKCQEYGVEFTKTEQAAKRDDRDLQRVQATDKKTRPRRGSKKGTAVS